MEIISDTNQINEILQQWSGAILQVRYYHVSLRRIAILLTRSGMMNEEVLYIAGMGCQQMHGFFNLEEVALSIIALPVKGDFDSFQCLVCSSGMFELRANSFHVAKGHLSEFGDGLHNLFGGEEGTDLTTF